MPKKSNIIVIDGLVAIVFLNGGRRAFVDTDRVVEVSQYCWSTCNNGHSDHDYARTTFKLPNGKRKKVYLHHFIKGKPLGGLVTDHKDENGLNNTDSNLQFVTNPRNLELARLRNHREAA